MMKPCLTNKTWLEFILITLYSNLFQETFSKVFHLDHESRNIPQVISLQKYHNKAEKLTPYTQNTTMQDSSKMENIIDG